MTDPIASALQTCLEDYTTDQRGDIGSLLRLQAIEAVHVAWHSASLKDRQDEAQNLIALVCVLAAEKLDKVRCRAWNCLSEIYGACYPTLYDAHGHSGASDIQFVFH